MYSIHNKKQLSEIEEKFAKAKGLPFQEVLPQEEIREIIKEEIPHRNRILTPFIIIWAFLEQVIKNNSCKKQAKDIVAHYKSQGVRVELTDSAYCQARQKVPEAVWKNLTQSIPQRTEIPAEQLWCGRRIRIVDGSTVTMDDTEKNQDEYPQPSSQKPGCGFPMARIAVLFCLATGMVLQMHLDPLHISEQVLFQRIYQNLTAYDIVLGDRGCCSYTEIALLLGQKIDCVFRANARRNMDFRRGKIVNRYDHVVTWKKPAHKPKWMSREEYRLVPDEIVVRELRYFVIIPGFRTDEVTLVTTLLDPVVYSKTALQELYCLRWQAEINLRHLKSTMHMDFIRSKTPDMVRKQLWVHLLVYNLIRRVMWLSGHLFHVSPLLLSFKGTLDTIDVYLPKFPSCRSCFLPELYYDFLHDVALDFLHARPDRFEPRAIKRRAKFKYLTSPRFVYR